MRLELAFSIVRVAVWLAVLLASKLGLIWGLILLIRSTKTTFGALRLQTCLQTRLQTLVAQFSVAFQYGTF